MRHLRSSSLSTYYTYFDESHHHLHHVFNFDDGIYDIGMVNVDSGCTLNGYPVSEKVDKALREAISKYVKSRHMLKAICYEGEDKLKNVDNGAKAFVDVYSTMNDEQKHLVDVLLHTRFD